MRDWEEGLGGGLASVGLSSRILFPGLGGLETLAR